LRTKTWLVATLLACSGFCALMYRVAWLREFRLIFGESTLASAAASPYSSTRLRTDPWPAAKVTQRALRVVEILASRDKALARPMFDAMGQPFAVRGLEDVRLLTRRH
jgi:hypothetical protein